ncbi:MAG: 3-hydroxyacyl-CoA dehydrogenase NAD-binding domain-containing protein, partial [Pseudomonadota bacterium]
PRLVGLAQAASMIVLGTELTGLEAHAAGLVDALSCGDLTEQALAFAQHLVAADKPVRPTLALPFLRDDDKDQSASDILADVHNTASKKLRGQEAPFIALEVLAAGNKMDGASALALERERFLDRKSSTQAKAMRHLFMAEREAGRIPGLRVAKDALPTLNRIGIVGAGTMGSGIALACLAAGLEVVIREMTPDALEAGIARIRATLDKDAAKGRLSPEDVEARLARLSGDTAFEAFGTCDLVLEAVFETMAVKKEVFAAIEAATPPATILATNTSYLDVNEMAAATGRPERFLGLHFFSPAHIMKLLEIVRGDRTDPAVLGAGLALAKRLGKVGVVSGVCHGFIGNRMLQAYMRQANLLMLEGARPADIDAALVGFGMPMGPFAMADMAGLDISYSVRKQQTLAPEVRAIYKVLDTLVESGRKGQKTGAGVYRYEAGSRTPLPDPEVDDLIARTAKEQGIDRAGARPSPEEIVDRCILALVNEGAQILDEGIAYRAGDIDTVYANGYGFPRYHGGPMCYASLRGLPDVLNRITDFKQRLGAQWWEPAPLLVQAAERGAWEAPA